MSTEIQAGFPCPHLIMEEVVTLDRDRRSMKTKGPVANSASVRVLVNNQLYVPPGGLHVAAEVVSAVGPYNISRCSGFRGPDANVLVVTTSAGTLSVSLPESPRISATEVVRVLRLNEPLLALVTIDVQNGAIRLRDRSRLGSQSRVQVSGDGADLLGFVQKGARGRELYPGWTLASDSSVLPVTGPRGRYNGPSRYPKFVADVRGNPVIKVTYTAVPNRCPRCRATYVENDYRFDKEGEIITIVNEDLLYQACLKSILTRKGSNPYHSGYGSTIMERVGRKRASATAEDLRQDIMTALQKVQKVQLKQSRFQQVTNAERLYKITAVDVRPSPNDPTTFEVGVVVQNMANTPIRLNIVYSAPGAVALAGSTGKSLGTEPAGL